MEAPLRGPQWIDLPLGPAAAVAADQLRRAIEGRPSIETTTSSDSNRRLFGTVRGGRADLSIWDAHLRTRRKSWNIEFHGTFEDEQAGSRLRGTLDIRGRRQLSLIVGMLQIGGGALALIAVVVALRDFAIGVPIVYWDIVVAVVVASVVVLVLHWMEADGERAAGDDARQLINFLERLLE